MNEANKYLLLLLLLLILLLLLLLLFIIIIIIISLLLLLSRTSRNSVSQATHSVSSENNQEHIQCRGYINRFFIDVGRGLHPCQLPTELA